MEALAWTTLVISGARGAVVLAGLAVMLTSRKRDIEWGRSMRIAFPEPFLLLFATAWLAALGPIAPLASLGQPGVVVGIGSVMRVVGVLMSLFGAWLFVSSLWINRGVGTGHYVEDNQVIVDTGPYGIMRHPLYGAAIFIWLGMSLAHFDWALLTFVYAYVLPAYYFYAKDEEVMMVRSFGDRYAKYARTVPMLFPRSLAIWE